MNTKLMRHRTYQECNSEGRVVSHILGTGMVPSATSPEWPCSSAFLFLQMALMELLFFGQVLCNLCREKTHGSKVLVATMMNV